MGKAFAAITCVICLTVAGFASGAFDPGAYTGKTATGHRVTFKLTRTKLRQFRLKSTYTCQPGGNIYNLAEADFYPLAIAPDGRFSQTSSSRGYHFLIRGRAVGKRVGRQLVTKVEGVFKARRTYDSDGNFTNENVALTCVTGLVHFRAHER